MINHKDRWRLFYVCLLGGIGVFLSINFVTFIFNNSLKNMVILFPFLIISLAIVVLSLYFLFYWNKSGLKRVTIWSIGAAISFSSVVALIGFYLEVFSSFILVRVLLMGFAPGCLSGTLVGVYDARSRERQLELEEKNERVERFANKAADINNYGRLLNEAENIDEVSSLLLEAIGVLIGYKSAAFVELVEEEVVFLEDISLEELGQGVREFVFEVIDRDEGAEIKEFGKYSFWIFVPVPRHKKCLVIELEDVSVFEKEDVRLLEILVSHVMTSLDHLENNK